MAKLTPKELQAAHKELKSGARKRIAERGILQFRADASTITAVLEAAEAAQIPVGALLRQWIQEKLMIDIASRKAPDLLDRVAALEKQVAELRKKVR
jgi:hypothetical protein